MYFFNFIFFKIVHPSRTHIFRAHLSQAMNTSFLLFSPNSAEEMTTMTTTTTTKKKKKKKPRRTNTKARFEKDVPSPVEIRIETNMNTKEARVSNTSY